MLCCDERTLSVITREAEIGWYHVVHSGHTLASSGVLASRLSIFTPEDPDQIRIAMGYPSVSRYDKFRFDSCVIHVLPVKADTNSQDLATSAYFEIDTERTTY